MHSHLSGLHAENLLVQSPMYEYIVGESIPSKEKDQGFLCRQKALGVHGELDFLSLGPVTPNGSRRVPKFSEQEYNNSFIDCRTEAKKPYLLRAAFLVKCEMSCL